MSPTWILLLTGAASTAVGLRLLLPPSGLRLRIAGGVALAFGMALLASQCARWEIHDDWGFSALFWIVAAGTIAFAIGTVTLRNPVYCAVWFALTLMGTTGLMLVQGAQFLGIATLAVYAGAILVTFLFVLMLAQPAGHAYYDRVSWEGTLASIAASAFVGIIAGVMRRCLAAVPPEASMHSREELVAGVLASQHVAGLGAELFSRHLVAVQVAGTLLLAALVAAVAIVIHGRQSPSRGEEFSHA